MKQNPRFFSISSHFFIPAVLAFYPWFFFTQLVFLPPAYGWDPPFDNASNWGGTGLLEIPTARVLGDGVIRFGYSQADPYRWYWGGMGVFPCLEVSGRFTEVTNIESGLGSDYGATKDKALDLKFQVLRETRKFPAVAIGINDFHGTKLYEAQYLVASRQVFPFDFSLGIGRGRLRGLSFPLLDEFRLSSSFLDELGFFGGVECAIAKRLHLILEYNPIKYEEDPNSARGVPEGADWPFNMGVRAKLLPGVDLGLSYQRGDTIGFMLHFQVELGKPLTPKRSDPPLWYSVDRRPSGERDCPEITDRIFKVICEAGFRDVSVSTDGKILVAEFENNKYLSNQKAAGRVLRILLFYSPSDATKITAVVKRRRVPILQISVKPEYLENYLYGRMTDIHFSKRVEIQMASPYLDGELTDKKISSQEMHSYFRFGIKPSLETFFNDPSGVFKARVGIKPYIETTLWRGFSIFGQYNAPFYSNISSSNAPLPDAVRSDAWQYLDRDYSFDSLLMDQAIRLSEKTFGRVSCGYFENMYAGIGGEILSFIGKGDLALGFEADYVKKREPATQFDLLDFKKYTLLGNAYYRIPKIGVVSHVQYGRFLAGDRGWMFEFSREYSTGARVGFWYSYTDTDDFTEFNKGYHNKGIFMNLPAQIFMTHDSNLRYHYSVEPWTRDVAATVFHWNDLFTMFGDLMPGNFKRDLHAIKK